eukprot:TRINITY_DN16271_c0_g1_i1.p1 TRINITY_DN16271_c0_g1~~TRINITY_DN16271_c0_g1_i1.p1  ORF type:complete len:147 (-),score=17.99 TRINITY_DN16271_c0_g1_i1:311-751(-)
MCFCTWNRRPFWPGPFRQCQTLDVCSIELQNEGNVQKFKSPMQHDCHRKSGDEDSVAAPSTSLAAMIFWYGLPCTTSCARVESTCGRSTNQTRRTSFHLKQTQNKLTSRDQNVKVVGTSGCAKDSSARDVMFFASPMDALHALDNM